MIRFHECSRWLSAAFTGLCVAALLSDRVTAQSADNQPVDSKPVISSADRVAFVGGGWVERMQQNEWIEAMLTVTSGYPTFRNVGWSGDTVFGEARAVFGSPDDGYARLLRDMEQAKPTIAFLCYGENESARGKAGIEAFSNGYQRLIDDLSRMGARSILVVPRKREIVPGTKPDPKSINESFAEYAQAIRKLAEKNKLKLIDLESFLPDERLTTDGVYWTEKGYLEVAKKWVASCGMTTASPKIVLGWGEDKNIEVHIGTGDYAQPAECTIQAEGRKLMMTLKSKTPILADGGAVWLSFSKSTDEAKYRIACGDHRIEVVGPGPHRIPVFSESMDELRELIARKNQWFFHRYRPQNETYLFLFRKHEQGNNAAELDQIPAHVESLEAAIKAWASAGPGSSLHTAKIEIEAL